MFHVPVWCEPHQKLSLMPFLWQIKSEALESSSLFNINRIVCAALHRSFLFKLEIHLNVPLSLSSCGNHWNNEIVGNGFKMIASFFWNAEQDEAFSVINTFQSLHTKSANRFSVRVIFLRKLSRTESICCRLQTSGELDRGEIWIKLIPNLPGFGHTRSPSATEVSHCIYWKTAFGWGLHNTVIWIVCWGSKILWRVRILSMDITFCDNKVGVVDRPYRLTMAILYSRGSVEEIHCS